MVVQIAGVYNPLTAFSDLGSQAGFKGMIYYDLRFTTRQGNVVIDWGEFRDLLSYSDDLSLNGAAGSFTIRAKANRANTTLLTLLHPGLIIDVCACQNDNPLRQGEASDPLDRYYHLINRVVIVGLGIQSGSSGEEIIISGDSYGKVYRDAYVLLEQAVAASGINTGAMAALSLITQRSYFSTVEGVSESSLTDYRSVMPDMPQTGKVLSFMDTLLQYFVEEFWGNSTGWIARRRDNPKYPPFYVQMPNEGSVWNHLNYLVSNDFFHMFVDHTGAINWEKLPYSSRDREAYSVAGRFWEDLSGPFDLPSHLISGWNSRLNASEVRNVARAIPSLGLDQSVGGYFLLSFGYNLGSIKQYGGARRIDFRFPIGLSAQEESNDPLREAYHQDWRSILDLAVKEGLPWYDRPIKRVSCSVPGQSGWRTHTRVAVRENWANPNAEIGEYYVVSRSHQIDFQRGHWATSLSLLSDRRQRNYLPATTIDPDDYWWYNRALEDQREIGENMDAVDSQMDAINSGVSSTSATIAEPNPSGGGSQLSPDYSDAALSQGGIASPLRDEPIANLLEYQPSEGQSFTAWRESRQDYHNGIDFDSRVNGGAGAAVAAVQGGSIQVYDLGPNATGGQSVGLNIHTTDSQGRPVRHQYNHLDGASVLAATGVAAGGSGTVRPGQLIGVVSSTDSHSSGPHLDYKVQVNGQFVNPQQYLAAAASGGGQAQLTNGQYVTVVP
ncbi:MAG: hypothetical protein DDT26_01044 [Dehalococcoidia bacterium]|nr:hypothetical protein [Chloroflexota bacterium]